MNSVRLTKRVKVGDSLRYCTAVVNPKNGTIKPDYVLIDKEATKCVDGTYYIDWLDESGKRQRLAVGKRASEAERLRERKETELNAVSQGIEVVPSKDAPDDKSWKTKIEDARVAFLKEIELKRKPKTYKGYVVALRYFQESCSKKYMEDLDKLDLLEFSAFLKTKKKQSPRSVFNKFACLLTFLSENKIYKLVDKNDRPRYVDEQVEIYEEDEHELDRLFAVSTPYHVRLYKFLLMTGMREREVMYCQWQDINFKAGTVNVRLKTAYNFDPKSYREREVPIPDELVKILTGMRPKDAKGTALVFCTASGRPDTHMLRALKRNAKRAGMDPDRFYLHKFRATFATRHLQNNSIDLRTMQYWMGHTNLESTIRYLKPARNQAVREMVNKTFAKAS